MKTRVLQWILALPMPLVGWAAEPVGADVFAEPTPAEPPADIALWFPPGETMEYNIYWGRVPVARSRATSAWVEWNGRTLLAIRFETKSNAVLSTLYPVDDFVETLVDPDTFLPVRFTKNLREGRHRYHEVTTFDHAAGTAHLRNLVKDSEKTYPIDSDTRDLVSFMYAMRNAQFQVGTEQDFRVMADEKLYDLTIKALGQEQLRLDSYGKVKTVKLEPEAAFQGLFVRKGKMMLWVTEDDRQLLAKASIKVPVANVNVVLDKVGGPGDDVWADPAATEPRQSIRGRRRQ
jgi:hypothetical protein